MRFLFLCFFLYFQVCSSVGGLQRASVYFASKMVYLLLVCHSIFFFGDLFLTNDQLSVLLYKWTINWCYLEMGWWQRWYWEGSDYRLTWRCYCWIKTTVCYMACCSTLSFSLLYLFFLHEWICTGFTPRSTVLTVFKMFLERKRKTKTKT